MTGSDRRDKTGCEAGRNSQRQRDRNGESRRIVFWGLNRRKQRRGYSWATFNEMRATLDIPGPRVVELPKSPNPQWMLSYS